MIVDDGRGSYRVFALSLGLSSSSSSLEDAPPSFFSAAAASPAFSSASDGPCCLSSSSSHCFSSLFSPMHQRHHHHQRHQQQHQQQQHHHQQHHHQHHHQQHQHHHRLDMDRNERPAAAGMRPPFPPSSRHRFSPGDGYVRHRSVACRPLSSALALAAAPATATCDGVAALYKSWAEECEE